MASEPNFRNMQRGTFFRDSAVTIEAIPLILFLGIYKCKLCILCVRPWFTNVNLRTKSLKLKTQAESYSSSSCLMCLFPFCSGGSRRLLHSLAPHSFPSYSPRVCFPPFWRSAMFFFSLVFFYLQFQMHSKY